mgnify:CR=1 FL=1
MAPVNLQYPPIINNQGVWNQNHTLGTITAAGIQNTYLQMLDAYKEYAKLYPLKVDPAIMANDEVVITLPITDAIFYTFLIRGRIQYTTRLLRLER